MTGADVEIILQKAHEKYPNAAPRVISDNVPLESTIGYIAPKDKLEGRENEIFSDRDRKLEAAREQRRRRRSLENLCLTNAASPAILQSVGETEAGTAGEQPARDSRPDFRRSVGVGVAFTPSQTPDIPEIIPMPQKPQKNNSLNHELEKSDSR